MVLHWEKIDFDTYRSKIYGGWLVKIIEVLEDVNEEAYEGSGQGITFIPDPDHKWKEKPYKE